MADVAQTVEHAPGNAWGWITHHTGIVLAGVVASVVAWFLIIRPASQSSQAQPQQVSYPGTGTPPGGAPPGAPTSPPTTPTLPYNVDWTVLNSIKGKVLKGLTTQELSLETQINDATLQGNTTLIAQLQAQLALIQQKISTFQPPGKKPTEPGKPPPFPPPGVSNITHKDVSNSLSWFTQWLKISPGASQQQLQNAWQYAFQNYQMTPGFQQFLNDQFQIFLNGPGGQGTTWQGNAFWIQALRNFRSWRSFQPSYLGRVSRPGTKVVA